MTTLGLTADARAQNIGTPLYDALVAEYRTALRCVPGEADDTASGRRRALGAMPRRPSRERGHAPETEVVDEVAEPTPPEAGEQDPNEEGAVRSIGAHVRQNAERRTRPA